jgi:hypothetical protein
LDAAKLTKISDGRDIRRKREVDELLFQTASCSLDSTSSILRIMTDNDLRRICQLELWMQKSDAKNPDLLKNFPSDASQKREEYRKENAI